MISFRKYNHVLLLTASLLLAEQAFCQTEVAVQKQESVNKIAEVMVSESLLDAALLNVLEFHSQYDNFDRRFSKYKNFDRKAVGEAFYLNLGNIIVPNFLNPNSTERKTNPVLVEKARQAHKQYLSSNFSFDELKQIAEFAQTSAGKKFLAPNIQMGIEYAKNIRDMNKWIGDEAEKLTVNQLGLKP